MRQAGNYLAKLLRLTAAGKFRGKSGLWHIVVAHDAGCGIDHGQRCDCDPEIYEWPQDNHQPRRRVE